MLSIIVASANPVFLESLENNINETIGVPFELLSYENNDGKKGIAEIYNNGAKMARYDVICFMHEDIQFKTQDWGKTIVRIIDDNRDLGLLGIAGSVYKSKFPSAWYSDSKHGNANYLNIIQHQKYSENPSEQSTVNPSKKPLNEVVTLDGVFLVTRRNIALQFPFDSVNFTGFHCYDIDFALSVSQVYKVYVTFEILLEHFSEGRYDKGWLDSTTILHQKWANKLPKSTLLLTSQETADREKRTFKLLLRQHHKILSFKYCIQHTVALNLFKITFWLPAVLVHYAFRVFCLQKKI